MVDSQIDSSTGFQGGAIYNDGSFATITDSAILSNTATWGGAIANYTNSNATLNNVSMVANTATSDGGGIYNYDDSTITIVDSNLAANAATGTGGAIINDGQVGVSTAILTGTTVLTNSAGTGGGGIYNFNGGILALASSMLVSNTSNIGGGIFNSINSLPCADYNSDGIPDFLDPNNPTNLVPNEQPQQPRKSIFLPRVEP
jgi:hypothetical protein